jgi:hypothetical protein
LSSYFDRLGVWSYADSGAMLRAAPAAPYSWVPETLVCETDPSERALHRVPKARRDAAMRAILGDARTPLAQREHVMATATPCS